MKLKPETSQSPFLSLPISEIILDDTISARPIDHEIAEDYREAYARISAERNKEGS